VVTTPLRRKISGERGPQSEFCVSFWRRGRKNLREPIRECCVKTAWQKVWSLAATNLFVTCFSHKIHGGVDAGVHGPSARIPCRIGLRAPSLDGYPQHVWTRPSSQNRRTSNKPQHQQQPRQRRVAALRTAPAGVAMSPPNSVSDRGFSIIFISAAVWRPFILGVPYGAV
jgi:hypothetical protein